VGPVEKAVREIIETEAKNMEFLTGVPQTDPRFPLAGVRALMVDLGDQMVTTQIKSEVAQDYLNAIYAIIGAYEVARLGQD
jgi:hypothetical protein